MWKETTNHASSNRNENGIDEDIRVWLSLLVIICDAATACNRAREMELADICRDYRDANAPLRAGVAQLDETLRFLSNVIDIKNNTPYSDISDTFQRMMSATFGAVLPAMQRGHYVQTREFNFLMRNIHLDEWCHTVAYAALLQDIETLRGEYMTFMDLANAGMERMVQLAREKKCMP
jgi:hypothetical protein